MPSERQATATQAAPSNEDGFHLGVMLAPADRYDPKAEGVVITAIDPDGVGAQQGLERGDVILNVNGAAVSNASQIRQALADAKSQGKGDVLLKIKARNRTVFVAIPLARS